MIPDKWLAIAIGVSMFCYSIAVLIEPRRGARWFGWSAPEELRFTPRYLRVYRIAAAFGLVFSAWYVYLMFSQVP